MSKRAMIWGATGGIGLALAQKLLSEGWQVAGLGRNLSALEGILPLAYEVDVTHPAQVEQAAYAVAQELGEVDWWVYAAGDILSAPVKDMDHAAWERILGANLTGLYLAARASLPLLGKQTPLYALGAVSERMRLPGLAAYAAAKAGVEALGEVLRKELRRPVVVVRPAAVRTALWNKVPFRLPGNALSPEDLAARLLENYQQGYQGDRLDL